MRELKISPSEAWKLDFVEISHLVEFDESDETDLSVSLEFRRKLNGASKEWLQNH
ncbi:MAG: hypothetical protein GY928_16395 [Colwellia sp.]|nr:hypothetical protein [Colwellia sp.]